VGAFQQAQWICGHPDCLNDPCTILLDQGKVILSAGFLSYLQGLALALKTEAKQAFSNSVFSASSLTRTTTSFSSGPTVHTAYQQFYWHPKTF